MIIQQLSPEGRVLETIDLVDCFGGIHHDYQRYKVITDDGTYMLTEETCTQIGWRIPDDEILPDNDNFKFR